MDPMTFISKQIINLFPKLIISIISNFFFRVIDLNDKIVVIFLNTPKYYCLSMSIMGR